MKPSRLKATLKMILTPCLILLILPVSSVHQSVVEVAPQQTSSLVPEDFDLLANLNDNPNEYQKVWEPWLTKAAVHAIATSEDGDFLAVGGGYLYDNEVHIYRWNPETREYDKVWDSGDGIIKGDVLSLAFGDTDNNKFMDIVAGSADGHIYVFEQRHIYDPYTRTENQFEHVWTSPKMRPVFSVLVEDTDKDGVLDILAGSWDGKVRAYEYGRHSGYPFSTEHWIDYEEVWNSGDVITDKVTAITTADTDYNGLQEIIAGTQNGSIYILENDGAVLYVEGVPFPITNDNSYVLKSTISGYVWKPILSLDSGDLDEDSDDEIVALAAGQGTYVIDYRAPSYRLNKLTRPLHSWELGAGHPLDYYVDDMVSAAGVFFSSWPEPMEKPPQAISPKRTAMAGEADGRYSTFRPFLDFVGNYGDAPWGITPEFPDSTAKWIWRFPWPFFAKVEEFWVTREFELASSVDLYISVTVDDYYTLYIDEMLVGNDTNWRTTETYRVSVSAGRHSLRMKVGNAGTEDYEFSAGLIVSVKDPLGAIVFNSQGDGTWRTGATAVLDFGKDEEATGNGNDFPDLIVNFSALELGFAAEPNFEELIFLVSQDSATFAAIEAKDLQSENFDGGFYVYIDLDRALAEKRWDYVRYLNITARGDGKYAVDSIKAETLYRPLNTATAATIRSLNLDSQHIVWEFSDRLEAYSTGVDYEKVVEKRGRKEEPNKVVIGTADGRLLAFGYDSVSESYDQIWDSYTEDWFNMKSNIWAIEEVKTLGKIPTWVINETTLDVPLSFKIDYSIEDYASMTFADVNLNGKLDLIVGTKQGNLTSPTSPTIEGFFSVVNTEYTDKWVSAAFGQLNTSGIIKLPPIKLDVSTSTMESPHELSLVKHPWLIGFSDHFELIIGFHSPGSSYGGLDYWDFPYTDPIPLADMESTGYLKQALRRSSTLPKAALDDIDRDGDVDITVTNGRIFYLENVGNKTDPSFEMKPDYYSSINLMNPDKAFSGSQLVDLDLDGDLDLIVGFANKHGATYFKNTGTAQNPVWVEARRLFYNSKYSFRNDNFTDPAFYDAKGLYDILEAKGEELPARDVFVEAYADTFGTFYVMSAYNNATNEIVAFIGETGSHSRFVVGTNPRVARLEVALEHGPLRNYGYHVFETWNNDADLDEWTITVASGDVDSDGKNEVIVGDFDNNMYVFEHLTNNTYKRAFRSFDINHTVTSEESPYAWEELEGLSGKFYRIIWDHAEHLVADTDLDNDGTKEIIAAADLSICVFEWTGIDDEYKLIWHEDLRKSIWAQDLKDEGIEKISALSYHKDLDKNGYGEIIVGAGSFLFIYESRPSDMFVDGRLSFPGHTIQTSATGDTDSDGDNEIIVGGFNDNLDGFVYVLENREGTYSAVWSAPSNLMTGNSVNAIIIDDQDYDGRKELIVGHEYGINIWEHTGGTGNQYDTMEVITSSPTYTKVELFPSLSWSDPEIPSFRRNSDIIQLKNGTLIQVYSRETGVTIDMGPLFPAENESRLSFRTSNDNGATWTDERRLTDNAEYESLITWNPDYTIVFEIEPSITESEDGDIWFTWATVVSELYIGLFPVPYQPIYAKCYRASTSAWFPDLFTVVSPTEAPYYGAPATARDQGYSLSIWNHNRDIAVSYINSTDRRVHYKTCSKFYFDVGMWYWIWRHEGALPYIGRDPSFPFVAHSIDMVTLRDGSRALTFAGRYKTESKVDDDIWAMALNSTMGWKFPNRVTVKSSQEKHPSITQLNSKDETIIVVFESQGGPPEEAIQISYSKDLGRSWSEPEPLSAMGEEQVSPSVTARKEEGFFYSLTTSKWTKDKKELFKRIIYTWTIKYGISVGVNPSSNWTKYEIGNVHTLAVGDTDKDGLREIAANRKNRATLFEIKHTDTSYQEHKQVWTSEELPEAVSNIAIGDGNGNGWPEIIIAAKRGNVHSYEITDTTLPQTFLIAAKTVEIKALEESTSTETINFTSDSTQVENETLVILGSTTMGFMLIPIAYSFARAHRGQDRSSAAYD